MDTQSKLPACWAVVLLVAAPGLLFGQSPAYQSDFPPEEFRGRWAATFDRMGERSIAIIQGAPKPSGFVFPRQSNEFYYLCGIETPHAYLVLDGRDRKVTLFLPPRDEALERAEGRVLSADDAEAVKNLTGVDRVASTRTMDEDWIRQLVRGRAPWSTRRSHPRKGSRRAAVRFRLPTRRSLSTTGTDGPHVNHTSSGCSGRGYREPRYAT